MQPAPSRRRSQGDPLLPCRLLLHEASQGCRMEARRSGVEWSVCKEASSSSPSSHACNVTEGMGTLGILLLSTVQGSRLMKACHGLHSFHTTFHAS